MYKLKSHVSVLSRECVLRDVYTNMQFKLVS